MNRLTWVAALALLCAVSGCARATMVYREPTGGQLALHGNERRAMQEADAEMAAHCGGDYQIVREENVVVGREAQGFGQVQTWGSGGQVVAQGSEQPITEHRITYACR